MVRHRLLAEVVYGHFAEYVETAEEMNRLAVSKGLREYSLWTPTVGTGNQVIFEAEYPDLATFERDTRAFYKDADLMKLVRRLAEITVQSSSRDELIEPAPHVA